MRETTLVTKIMICVATGAAASAFGSLQTRADQPQTCTEVQTYCMKLCSTAEPPAPATWSCEANRCSGLAECLNTGTYRIGTQYGHRPPNRTTYGPYEKK